MKNGRDDHYDDPKITSISAARRKAAQGKKATAAAAFPKRSISELIFGAVLIAMAIGMLVQWARPLWQPALTSN